MLPFRRKRHFAFGQNSFEHSNVFLFVLGSLFGRFFDFTIFNFAGPVGLRFTLNFLIFLLKLKLEFQCFPDLWTVNKNVFRAVAVDSVFFVVFHLVFADHADFARAQQVGKLVRVDPTPPWQFLTVVHARNIFLHAE